MITRSSYTSNMPKTILINHTKNKPQRKLDFTIHISPPS